jgi:hypothetical protein
MSATSFKGPKKTGNHILELRKDFKTMSIEMLINFDKDEFTSDEMEQAMGQGFFLVADIKGTLIGQHSSVEEHTRNAAAQIMESVHVA